MMALVNASTAVIPQVQLYLHCTHARYTAPAAYHAAFAAARGALLEAFLGPPACGVYSPSVQYTLFQMGALLLERCACPHAQGERDGHRARLPGNKVFARQVQKGFY